MSKRDEYRRNAALCHRMADESTKDDDKRQWAKLEQAWLDLIRTNERALGEAFDAEHC